jgi:hypothetical protein
MDGIPTLDTGATRASASAVAESCAFCPKRQATNPAKPPMLALAKAICSKIAPKVTCISSAASRAANALRTIDLGLRRCSRSAPENSKFSAVSAALWGAEELRIAAFI